MTRFHQAAARGLHPVRAWMTQRQRLEAPVHAFPTSLQRRAGRRWQAAPAPTLTGRGARNCIRRRRTRPQPPDQAGTPSEARHIPRNLEPGEQP